MDRTSRSTEADIKLIIAGSRDLDLTLNKLDEIIKATVDRDSITEVVSGGAKGVDWLGEIWANTQYPRIPVKVFQADWEQFGLRAGPYRNDKMGRYADVALVIMKAGGSKGSKNMISIMKKLNKPVHVVEV